VLFLNPHDSVPANIERKETQAEIDSLIKLKRENEGIANSRNFQNGQGNREARQAAREAADKATASLKAFGISTRTLYVRSIDTDGPENPPPPKRPDTHVRLMAHAAGLDPRSAAREIVTRFASKAFRRPVRPTEVDDCTSLYDVCAKQNMRFELCVRAALLRVLVSPYFLYRVEIDPANVEPGATYAISEYDLASQLSYFLWNSMPDDDLMGLASNGKLRSEIGAQVQRL